MAPPRSDSAGRKAAPVRRLRPILQPTDHPKLHRTRLGRTLGQQPNQAELAGLQVNRNRPKRAPTAPPGPGRLGHFRFIEPRRRPDTPSAPRPGTCTQRQQLGQRIWAFPPVSQQGKLDFRTLSKTTSSCRDSVVEANASAGGSGIGQLSVSLFCLEGDSVLLSLRYRRDHASAVGGQAAVVDEGAERP